MPTITILDNGLILFQFHRDESQDWALENDPWHLGGKPILLRKWFPGIVSKTFVFESLPIWIHLARIPLELWTNKGLAVVVSAMGRPIHLDEATRDRKRCSYARVCVKVDGDALLPLLVTIRMRGQDFVVHVSYEWKSRKCLGCGSFRHSEGGCGSVKHDSFPS
ncbi:uncharacterized protein LOC120069410 [Benincasa hispida]|uniref:uncharacterized protein LOC120069410 n=1 Tax=Benincasa hispida TaxID=102211 RepID=UPI0019028955|nr:uncharacterized protein LOC120069410 [Benincasa hispida]